MEPSAQSPSTRVSKNLQLGDCVNPFKGKIIATIVIGMILGSALLFGGLVSYLKRPQAQFALNISDNLYIKYYDGDVLNRTDNESSILTRYVFPFMTMTQSDLENNAVLNNLILFKTESEILDEIITDPTLLQRNIGYTLDLKGSQSVLITGLEGIDNAVQSNDINESYLSALNGNDNVYQWLDVYVSFQYFVLTFANYTTYTIGTDEYTYISTIEPLLMVKLNPFLDTDNLISDSLTYFSNYMFTLGEMTILGLRYNTQNSTYKVDLQYNGVDLTLDAESVSRIM